MRLMILAAAAAVAVLAQTPANTAKGGGAAAPAGNAQNGKKIFESDGCYQCHGLAAQGGVGPRLGPRPLSWAAFSRYVRQPTDQMPPYTAKVVSDQELADVYAFLLAIPAPPAAKGIPILNQ
jgi:mono/diheme cytochrome c family protein